MHQEPRSDGQPPAAPDESVAGSTPPEAPTLDFAIVIARLLHGEPLGALLEQAEQLPPPHREHAFAISMIDGVQARRKEYGRIVQQCDQAGDLLARVTRAIAEVRPKPDDEASPPPMPAGVQIDASLGADACPWLDRYVEYAMAVAPMTPRDFHVSAALWLASVVIARRLVLRMPFGEIHPNLFIAWIAPSTLYTKTTALCVARGIARRAFPHLLAVDDTTPEALLSDMSGAEPANLTNMTEPQKALWTRGRAFCAQRGWLIDEISALPARAGRDYNAGFIELLLRLYDCDPHLRRSTRGQGLLELDEAYLTILGASTPEALAPHLAPSSPLWPNGFWPRFALLTPEPGRPEYAVAEDVPEPGLLVEVLRALDARLPQPEPPGPAECLSMALGTGVHEALARYTKACRYDLQDGTLGLLGPTYGRLPAQTLKVAMLLAALDWSRSLGAPVVELKHLARAMEVVERWRASAHRVMSSAAASEFARLRTRIMKLVYGSEPQGITFRDLSKAMKDVTPPSKIQKVLDELLDAGELDRTPASSGPQGGRPTARYRVFRLQGDRGSP